MTQITTNQHSYTNISALLSVAAMAERTGENAVDITASWEIYTAASYFMGANRYLVLFLGSATGEKYYSEVIGTDWYSATKYKGTCKFKGIPLDVNETEITIGFGVSGSNASMSAGTTLIWNGEAKVNSPDYDPDIQFAAISGIEKWYTACTVPSEFSADRQVFEYDFKLMWSGAQGGTNNDIVGYTVECQYSENGTEWGDWIQVWSGVNDSLIKLTIAGIAQCNVNITRGNYYNFRICTRGSAGISYYSEWKNLVVSLRRNSLPETPTNPGISTMLVTSGDVISVFWDESSDVDGNHNGYELASWTGDCDDEMDTISVDITTERMVELNGPPGVVTYFFVRAVDALGATSDWLEIGYVTINSAPEAPQSASISAKEFSPGDELTIAWDGARDPDGNICGYEICYCASDAADKTPDHWEMLEEVPSLTGDGVYKFTAGLLIPYHFYLHLRIRTVDTLGAFSEWLIIGSVLRNDVPYTMVGCAGEMLRFVPEIAEVGSFARYMPYIYKDGFWERYPGIR